MAVPNLISGDTILDVRLESPNLIIEVQSCCDAAPRTFTVDLTGLPLMAPLTQEDTAETKQQ